VIANEALFDHVAARYDSWYDTELRSVSDQVERHLWGGGLHLWKKQS